MLTFLLHSIQVAYASDPAHQLEFITPEDPDAPVPDFQSLIPVLRLPGWRLPDLRTLQLSSSGQALLRLANTVWNSGGGPLELIGQTNPFTRQIRVVQQIYSAGEVEYQNLIGEFVWHPTHDHWHFADFALYELWSISPNGSRDRLVASSDKLSYCVIDTDVINPRHPYFEPRRHFFGCDQTRQGISAGWGDTYDSHLDGQALDITGLPNGHYMLISKANPSALLIESNYQNNTASIYLGINGTQLKELHVTELSEIFCLENGLC